MMRTLNYKLADGTVVKTFDEAKASEQRFTNYLKDVPRARGKVSKIRNLCLRYYGVVNATTIAKIKQAAA